MENILTLIIKLFSFFYYIDLSFRFLIQLFIFRRIISDSSIFSMIIQRNLTNYKKHNTKIRNSSAILTHFDCSFLQPKPEKLQKRYFKNKNYLFPNRRLNGSILSQQKKQNLCKQNHSNMLKSFESLDNKPINKTIFIQSITFTQNMPDPQKNIKKYIQQSEIQSNATTKTMLQSQKVITLQEKKNIFRIIQEEQQKIKEKQKANKKNPLQITSKQLLQKLDKQFKFDFQSNQLRSRYLSMFHNRTKSKKSFIFDKMDHQKHSFFFRKFESQSVHNEMTCDTSSIQSIKCKQILSRCSPSAQDIKTKQCMKMFKNFSLKLHQKCTKKKVKLQELKKFF